jgi:HEAT repeat protein
MKRFWLPVSVALLAMISQTAGVRADGEEPELRGRKLSEWLEMLRGEQAEKGRLTAQLALGPIAANAAAWQPIFAQSRRAGLLAVELIGSSKSRFILPAVCTTLREDRDEKMRENAAMALGRMGGKMIDEAKEQRKKGLVDDKPRLQLGEVRDTLAIALRNDKSPRVREASANALGKLEWMAADVVSAMASALKDESLPVRAAAADALRRLGPDAADALPALQEVLKDDKADRLTRVQVAQAIGRQGSNADVDVDLLLKVWHDPKAPADVRAAVAECLEQLKRTSTAVDLGKELENAKNDLEIRRAAAKALDSFEGSAKPAQSELRKALHDDDKYVRCLAMHALGKIGKDLGEETKDIVKDLFGLLEDRVLEVKISAIETLGNIGSEGLGDQRKAVVDRLTEITRDTQKGVREAATEAIKKLTK